MRMETCIRKQLRVKAHWVTKVEAEAAGVVAWVELSTGFLFAPFSGL